MYDGEAQLVSDLLLFHREITIASRNEIPFAQALIKAKQHRGQAFLRIEPYQLIAPLFRAALRLAL
jgi:hypothetical protein